MILGLGLLLMYHRELDIEVRERYAHSRQWSDSGACSAWCEEHARCAEVMGDDAFEAGNMGQAIRLYTAAERLGTSSARLYRNRGTAKSRLGFDYPGAIEDLSEAIRLNPDDALAWNNRGVAKMRLGLNRASLDDYRRAIELATSGSRLARSDSQPSSFTTDVALRHRSVAYRNLGMTAQAEADELAARAIRAGR